MAGQSITIQLGTNSNYIATHVWNYRVQNNPNNRYVFREEVGSDGRPCPRAIVIDYKDHLSSALDVEDEEEREAMKHIWRGNIQRVEQSHLETRSSKREKSWLDMIQFTLSERSRCEIPLWSASGDSTYNHYFAGAGTDIISNSEKDSIFDQVRYMMEECDRVDSIPVYADIFDGFGGLCQTLLEEIRQELPSVTTPVWGMSDKFDSLRSGLAYSAGSVGDHLEELSLPLVYDSILEHATMLVPLHPSSVTQFCAEFSHLNPSLATHASSLLADAMTTCYDPVHYVTSSQHTVQLAAGSLNSDSMSSPSRMCSLATGSARFPVCRLEATTKDPFLMSEASSESLSGATISKDDRSDNRSRAADPRFGNLTNDTLNPFMKSLSAINFGPYSVGGRLAMRRTRRAYTNIIGYHKPLASNVGEYLFSQCLGSNYLLTHVFPPPFNAPVSHSLSTTAVEIETPSASAMSMFGLRNAASQMATSATYFQSTNLVRMASVGSDVAVGWHLQNLANSMQLSNRSRSEASGSTSHHCASLASGDDGEEYDDIDFGQSITGRATSIESRVGGEMVSAQLLAQLRKVNMSADDCDEVRERLLAFAQRY